MKILKTSSVILAFLLVFILLCPAVSAESGLIGISDDADVISANAEAEAAKWISKAKDDLNLNIYIATVNSLGGKSAESFADDYYDSIFSLNSYGIILVVCPESRDYSISTSGNAISDFEQDGRIDVIEDKVIDSLRENDYSTAALTFAKLSYNCISAVYSFNNGEPWENSYDYEINDYWVEDPDADKLPFSTKVIISFVVAIAIAFIVVGIMKGTMNNARKNNRAQNYIRKNSFNLTKNFDLYLYSTVSKTRRSSSSSSGSGSSHTSSSGASHGGRSGKF